MVWAPGCVSNAAKRSKPTRIHAMRFVYKNRTGQPWDKPGHDEVESQCKRPLVSVIRSQKTDFRLLNSIVADLSDSAAAAAGAATVGAHVALGDLKQRRDSP